MHNSVIFSTFTELCKHHHNGFQNLLITSKRNPGLHPPLSPAIHSYQSVLCLYESESRSVVSNPLQPHGLYSPWNSPGNNTGVGSLSLLQGIFPPQGLNPGLPHQSSKQKGFKLKRSSTYGGIFRLEFRFTRLTQFRNFHYNPQGKQTSRQVL